MYRYFVVLIIQYVCACSAWKDLSDNCLFRQNLQTRPKLFKSCFRVEGTIAFSYLLASSSLRNSKDIQIRDTLIQNFLELARELGPVGMMRPEPDRQRLVDAAIQLEQYSDSNPAKVPYRGIHRLVYSSAPGGSSGKFGPFIGEVSQEFLDDTTYINYVSFGPLKIALTAAQKVKSGKIVTVTFLSTTIYLFDIKLYTKSIGGGGSWKYIFTGTVQDKDGSKKLIRILQTPSLFVLEQPIS